MSFATGIRKSRHTNADSAQLLAAATTIAKTFNTIMRRHEKATLLFSEGACYVHQDHIRFSHLGGEVVSELQQHCLLRGLGGFSIEKTVTPNDVLAMIHAWRADVPEGSVKKRFKLSIAQLSEGRQRLDLKGEGPFSYVAQTQVENLLAEYSLVLPASSQKATLLFARLLARIRHSLVQMSGDQPANDFIPSIKRVIHDIIDEINNDVFRSRLVAWTVLRNVERAIVHHNAATAVFVIVCGRELGIERNRLAAMATAAALHDTMIDPKNPDGHRLWVDTTHYALKDPNFGRSTLYRMILPYEQLGLHVLELEPLDGQAPLFESQLLGLCCSLDRDCRDTYTPAYQALRSLLTDRSFHRAGATALVAALGVYPRGTVLRLTDGHLAVVVENGRHRLHRPLLRLLQRVDGSKIHEKTFVDLLDPNAPRVEGAVDERYLNVDVMQAVVEGISQEFEDIP